MFHDNINAMLRGRKEDFILNHKSFKSLKSLFLSSRFPFVPGDKLEHSNAATSCTTNLKNEQL